MLASISKSRNESEIKSNQKSKQIDTLYREFQSLKSQIYGKKQPIFNPKGPKWANRGSNQIKTHELLRESTIKKYQREFAEKMDIMQRSELMQSSKPSSKPYRAQKRQKRESSSDEMIWENKNFSKKLESFHEKECTQMSQIEQHQQVDQSVQSEEIKFSQGEQIFKQFINSPNRSFLPRRKPEPCQVANQDFKSLQALFESIAGVHCDKLARIIESMSYLTRKLHCLEAIVQEYEKITRVRREQCIQRRNNELAMVVNVKRIQHTYEEQIKGLVAFYEDRLKQAERDYRQSLKKEVRESELGFTHQFEEETNKMKNLLEQAKQLISTKQQLILSLNEENNELRDEIEALRKRQALKGSKQSSLLYSATNDKHAEAAERKIHANKVSKKLDEIYVDSIAKNGENLQQFQDQNDEQINYSQLHSLKDKSMDEWDISQLDLEPPSNNKSIAGVSIDLMLSNVRDETDMQQYS